MTPAEEFASLADKRKRHKLSPPLASMKCGGSCLLEHDLFIVVMRCRSIWSMIAKLCFIIKIQ